MLKSSLTPMKSVSGLFIIQQTINKEKRNEED